ncbi:MAG: YdbL family protein [Candidatus Nitrohelix vancouverensis]|uniref:YdbL family protein n=1 Tax=Candidatus Nitrohelix vancouverensis TaxID=2705534 RepID=A0A7T0G2S4_9BACT|nr:MAG: YdbL family protein [Candidatus Nitrohelix vancouverensis]
MEFFNQISEFKLHRAFGAGLFCLALSACGGPLVSVDVTVVDQKTALENQILGSYEEIGNDMLLLASVRSVDETGALKTVAEVPKDKRAAIQARQRQEFNQDDIAQFKKDACAGETAEGDLAFLDKTCANKDEQFLTFAKTIIAEENESRQVILERIIATNETFSVDDMPKVRKIFAGLNRDKAKPGEWIQLENGEWSVK